MSELQTIQTKRLYFEYDEPLVSIREKVLRRFFYAALALLFVAIYLGAVITFPKVINTEIVIKSSQVDVIYSFDHPIFVLKKYVNPSQSVKKGEALVNISSQAITQFIHKRKELENALKMAQSKQNSLVPAEHQLIRTESQKLSAENQHFEARKRMLAQEWEIQSANLQHSIQLAQDNYNRNQLLYNEKIISKMELENSAQKILDAQSMYNREKANYEENKVTIENLSQKNEFQIHQNTQSIQKVSIEGGLSLTEIQLALENLDNQLAGIFGTYRLNATDITLLAPADGFVNYLFDGEKELAAGEILLKLKNADSHYLVAGYANSTNISKIKEKSTAFIKIDAYPFVEYGTIQGTISNLSHAPDKEGRYPFEIAIEAPKNTQIQLVQGMKGLAAIHLAERTFWGHIFYKINTHIYDATNN